MKMYVHDLRIVFKNSFEYDILVGATDEKRWAYGVGNLRPQDERTNAWARVRKDRPGHASIETLGLHVPRLEHIERKAAIACLPTLLGIAWDIIDSELTTAELRDKWFGFEITEES